MEFDQIVAEGQLFNLTKNSMNLFELLVVPPKKLNAGIFMM